MKGPGTLAIITGVIWDCHTHIFPPWVRADRAKYLAQDACFAALYRNPKARLITAEELIAGMDAAGVDVSVVLNLGWLSRDLCARTNDYIMESVAHYPGRLVGFGAVSPADPEAAAEIGRIARGGLRGVGELRPDMLGATWADRAALAPVVAALVRHNLALLIHVSEPVGHTYDGKGQATPEVIYPFLTTFPDLTVILAHWGGGLPFYALMPEVRRALGRAYFDSAASPFLYTPEVYRRVIDLVGVEKVLFGSDYPVLPPGRLIKEIKSLGLSAEAEELVLSGNARRLFGQVGK